MANTCTCTSICHDLAAQPRQKRHRRHVPDVSATCPSRDWNVLAVSGGWSLRFCGFRRPRHANIYSGQCEDAARTRFLPWPYHVNWGFPVTSVGNSRTTTRPEASWRAQRRVTPKVTGLPRLLPRLAAANQAEDCTILS